jgi:hypothetical protein
MIISITFENNNKHTGTGNERIVNSILENDFGIATLLALAKKQGWFD